MEAIEPDLAALERAVLRAVAYSDIFEYPLTAGEIQRYLPGLAASAEMVGAALQVELAQGSLVSQSGYYALPGREASFAIRRQRQTQAQQLWPRAARYGRIMAHLPYVRMAAVTGALAMDNEPGRDLDFLVVTAPDRLWLTRALVIVLVRLAAAWGDVICPNYFLTTRALAFPERTLYTAHELAQMVPLAGGPVYQAVRQANAWIGAFLPNAGGPPRQVSPLEGGALESASIPAKKAAEALLNTSAGTRIESWEMRRKLRKLGATPSPEASFSADWCKGHFGGYGQRTTAAYLERLQRLEGLEVQELSF